MNKICDRILENGSKSHIKSSVFQHVFNYISTYAYVFSEYLFHNLNNLSIEFYVISRNNEYYSIHVTIINILK